MSSVFITVGSTAFDELITAATSPTFLDALESRGYSNAIFQAGASEPIVAQALQSYRGRIVLEAYKYKPSIAQDMAKADIIISHAGSGTILQALRMHKRMLVVVNTSLMDNHQTELAQAMAKENYLVCGETSNLTETLTYLLEKELAQFPSPNPERFASIMNSQMGFS